MVRKILVHLFLVSVTLTSVAALLIGVVCYLAVDTPSEYAQLIDRQYSDAEQAAAAMYVEQSEYGFANWLAREQGREQPSAHKVRFTQQQINALLSMAEWKSEGEFQDLRVRVLANRVQLAAQVVTSYATCVASATFEPSLTPERDLRFDMVAANIGRLPLPIGTLLKYLPQPVQFKSRKAQLNLSSPTPYMVFNLPGQGDGKPKLRSLNLAEGQITLEFLPPERESAPRNLAASVGS